ncbi:hypothetical protein V8E54_010174 [Elaphomyces granulatus]
MYTKDMSSAVLSNCNIYTPLGIVNGAQGKAVGVVLDLDAIKSQVFAGALSASTCDFEWHDLNGKPDKLLVQEDERIAQLARSTEIVWEQIEATAEFIYGRAYRMERAAQYVDYRFLALAPYLTFIYITFLL